MRATFLAILVGCGFLGVASLGSAQVAPPACNPNTTVYFGNGVNVAETEAWRSMWELESAFFLRFPSETCNFEFTYAYNQSSGLLLDIAETAKQTFSLEYPTLIVSYALGTVGQSWITGVVPPSDLDRFNETFRSRLVQEMVAGSSSTQTVNEHVSHYVADLTTKRVVVVAHSQGNIFATLAADKIAAEHTVLSKRFAVVPVASPEATFKGVKVGGGQDHVRFIDDLVILGVEVVRQSIGLPPPLDAHGSDNVDIDWKGHEFLRAYFADDTSRAFILNRILQTAQLLPPAPILTTRLNIRGIVTDAEFGFPKGGTRVRVQFIADGLDTVAETFTDIDGSYDLLLNDAALPGSFVIFFSSRGWIPVAISATPTSNSVRLDVQMRGTPDNVVIVEIEPQVHHLGNDRYSGAVNAQFQKLTEGLRIDLPFEGSILQEIATSAVLRLDVKGAQRNNPIAINGTRIGLINTSPSNGSFGGFSFPVPLALLLPHGPGLPLNVVTIQSVTSGLDYDDFEFANILIELTLP